MKRTRHTIAAGVAATLSAGLLAALSPVAASAQPAETRPVPIPIQEGFIPVRAFGGIVATDTPLAIEATDRGTLWLAARGRNGKLVMLRTNGARALTVQRQELDVQVSDNDGVTLDGSGDEAWMTVAGQLWHLHSGTWRRIADDRVYISVPTAQAVADAPGAGAYVAMRQFDERTGGYRSWIIWTDGAQSRALPPLPGTDRGPIKEPLDPSDRLTGPTRPLPVTTPEAVALRVARGTVFAELRKSGAVTTSEVYAHRRGDWHRLYEKDYSAEDGTAKVTAWLVPAADRHLLLGEVYSGSDRSKAHRIDGLSRTWTARLGERSDSTTGLVGAAGVLANGKTVIGNNAYRGEVTSHASGFVLRTAAGKETPLSGDAGRETMAMTVEPGTNTAWALTRNGTTVQLQRYAG